tara:strand:+ start:389 stop:553 length:165 start_codon:yes stop_codon:yes gene_type:complete
MTYRYIKNDIEGGNYTTCIQRIADNATIPIDDGNKDYIEYKAWLDAGNTPEAAE